MPLQIFQMPTPSPGILGNISGALGGLSSLLEAGGTLVKEHKEKKSVKDYLKSIGVNDEIAERISSLPAGERSQIIEGIQQKQGQPTDRSLSQEELEQFFGPQESAVISNFNPRMQQQLIAKKIEFDQKYGRAQDISKILEPSGEVGPEAEVSSTPFQQIAPQLSVPEMLQFKKLQAAEERPQRQQLVKEVADIEKSGRLANEKIQLYKTLKETADNPELRAGLWRQTLDMFNLGEYAQSPVSFVAEKLIGDINFASLSDVTTPGKATAAILREISKTNPSLLQSPEAIKKISDLKILAEKVKKSESDALEKVRNKSPRGILPLDAIQKARNLSKEKIKSLHKKQLEIARDLKKINKDKKKTMYTLEDIQKVAPDNPKEGTKIKDRSGNVIAVYNRGEWLLQ